MLGPHDLCPPPLLAAAGS